MDEKQPNDVLAALLDALVSKRELDALAKSTEPEPANQSASIGQLVAALASAEIPAVEKGSRNSHLNSKYASLDDMVAACRPVLRAAGLAIIQTFAPSKGGVTVVTTLAHKSGEWIRGSMFVPSPAAKGLSEEQTYGKAATYARRYGYQAMLSIAAEEDDDGHVVRDVREAERAPRAQTQPTSAPRSAPTKPYETLVPAAKSMPELLALGREMNDDPAVTGQRRADLLAAYTKRKTELALPQKPPARENGTAPSGEIPRPEDDGR